MDVPTSALGQKRTLLTVPFYVCFTPESGHLSACAAAGDRRDAIGKGFRTIADYIFGSNTHGKVPMTAPVTQQGSEKIAMTAPVTQQGDGNTWRVRFIMPSSYTMEALPKPNNPADGARLARGSKADQRSRWFGSAPRWSCAASQYICLMSDWRAARARPQTASSSHFSLKLSLAAPSDYYV